MRHPLPSTLTVRVQLTKWKTGSHLRPRLKQWCGIYPCGYFQTFMDEIKSTSQFSGALLNSEFQEVLLSEENGPEDPTIKDISNTRIAGAPPCASLTSPGRQPCDAWSSTAMCQQTRPSPHLRDEDHSLPQQYQGRSPDKLQDPDTAQIIKTHWFSLGLQ